MGISFTEEQNKVITLHNRNILVSAAAGSGKTAVLVERIVQMVSGENENVDIDRLLIVTFTNAAAAEMRERISHALTAMLEEHPESQHLQRQITLVHNAQITTIDSFCLFIIRNNFNDIGLDPSFRVGDEGELKLMKQEVMAELLEQKFEEGREDFYHCVECYAATGKEKILENHILHLYDFAISHPWPEEWLEERRNDYHISSLEELEKTEWIQFAIENIKELLEDLKQQYGEAIQLTLQPDGPYMYGELLEREQEALEACCRRSGFRELMESITTFAFDRLPSKKDDSVSQEKREQAKSMRNNIKDMIQDIVKRYFPLPLEQVIEQSIYSERAIKELISLSLEFKKKYDEKKREKNILDFADMEHFALNILLKKSEHGIEATKTAKEYRSFFHEILIDEYQDSNLVQEYLLKAVSGEEEGNFNRFMVGDVKQSIYKFRLARPELFMEKYGTYFLSEEDALSTKKQRIDLHKNFRSRREVLESVNYIFGQIMNEKLGGITYDELAALYPGAEFPENDQCQTELLLVEQPETEKVNVKELEARGIAKKIRELVENYQVTDKKSGELRPCKYQDIVVLLRTNSGWDEIFKEVFTNVGIPAHVTSKTGYFSTLEIQILLQFLRVLDNPLQDIPLFGAMKSILGKFTEEEIVTIRTFEKKQWLYEGLTLYAQTGEIQGLREKTQDFLTQIAAYREMATYLPIRKLLQTIITDYDYLYYVTALPAGEQRKANVEMLLEKAAGFEKTSYYGLFHFIRYMEQMEKYDVDFGEANILDENADVVRIMSIHKSKGLEFPVTIVAGLAKKFNMQDTSQGLIVDVDMGIGTDYINPQLRLSGKTLRKNVISRKMQLDNLGEELRILYVALTRAKEKLIMTGALKKAETKLREYIRLEDRIPEVLPYDLLSNSSNFLDYIIPSLIRHRCFATLLRQFELPVKEDNPLFHMGPEMLVNFLSYQQLQEEEIVTVVRQMGREEKIKKLAHSEQLTEKSYDEFITKRFSFQYPYHSLQDLYTKTTVSELKKKALEEKGELGKILFEEETIVPYLPQFMKEKESVLGTTRGSAFHKVMELLDLEEVLSQGGKSEGRKEILEKQLVKFQEEGRLSEEFKKAVSLEKIEQFLDSNLAFRMSKADKKNSLYREQPFVLGVNAKILKEEFPEEELVLIQGIIDVFFIEEDGIILADYKTDVIKKPEELIHKYKVQMDYYSEALEKRWNLPVKEKILYSFYLGKEIPICD